MRTRLRLTSVAILFISAFVLTFKTFDSAIALGLNSASDHGWINLKPDSQVSKPVISGADSESDYVPPNYGGPDSQYGSGTR